MDFFSDSNSGKKVLRRLFFFLLEHVISGRASGPKRRFPEWETLYFQTALRTLDKDAISDDKRCSVQDIDYITGV